MRAVTRKKVVIPITKGGDAGRSGGW